MNFRVSFRRKALLCALVCSFTHADHALTKRLRRLEGTGKTAEGFNRTWHEGKHPQMRPRGTETAGYVRKPLINPYSGGVLESNALLTEYPVEVLQVKFAERPIALRHEQGAISLLLRVCLQTLEWKDGCSGTQRCAPPRPHCLQKRNSVAAARASAGTCLLGPRRAVIDWRPPVPVTEVDVQRGGLPAPAGLADSGAGACVSCRQSVNMPSRGCPAGHLGPWKYSSMAEDSYDTSCVRSAGAAVFSKPAFSGVPALPTGPGAGSCWLCWPQEACLDMSALRADRCPVIDTIAYRSAAARPSSCGAAERRLALERSKGAEAMWPHAPKRIARHRP
jgi:hypothetical protein